MNLIPQVSSVKGSIKGRVLTRRVRFDNGRPCLEYFVASEAGPVQVNVDKAEWTCFCHQSQTAKLLNRLPQNKVQVAYLELKSFENQSVSVLYVKTAQELTQIKRVAIELGISLFETDIRPEQRFLIERFISFDAEFLGEFIQ
ncbi:MAG: DNA polymerase II, partial [Shewanella sp.]|nr:DNA polymerase II [Shewanella sp.]